MARPGGVAARETRYARASCGVMVSLSFWASKAHRRFIVVIAIAVATDAGPIDPRPSASVRPSTALCAGAACRAVGLCRRARRGRRRGVGGTAGRVAGSQAALPLDRRAGRERVPALVAGAGVLGFDG